MAARTEAVMNWDPYGLGHYLSVGGVLSALGSFFLTGLGYLPVIVGTLAGLGALIYYVVTLCKEPVIQRVFARWAARRRAKKVAKLQYQQTILVAELKELGALTHAGVSVHTQSDDTVRQVTTVETVVPNAHAPE